MSLPDIAEGIRQHRAFSRRSAKPYSTRLKNAEHYACLRDGTGWIIEPLGWARFAAESSELEQTSRGKPPEEGFLRRMEAAGWTRIVPGDAAFVELWQALVEWCAERKTAPSIRRDGPPERDRTFWLAPEQPAPS